MPSPFPGMDPYLEDPAFWSDFHASFITYWRDALIDCLPDSYEARIDEKVRLVEVAPPKRKLIEPDVAITQRKPSRSPSPPPAGGEGGQRLPFERPLPPGDYYAFVSRADRRPDCDAYAWPLRHALPAIPIPLLAPDPDVWLDVAAVFATTYERGRYARSLDYASPPPVRLDDETLGDGAGARRQRSGVTCEVEGEG